MIRRSQGGLPRCLRGATRPGSRSRATPRNPWCDGTASVAEWRVHRGARRPCARGSFALLSSSSPVAGACPAGALGVVPGPSPCEDAGDARAPLGAFSCGDATADAALALAALAPDEVWVSRIDAAASSTPARAPTLRRPERRLGGLRIVVLVRGRRDRRQLGRLERLRRLGLLYRRRQRLRCRHPSAREGPPAEPRLARALLPRRPSRGRPAPAAPVRSLAAAPAWSTRAAAPPHPSPKVRGSATKACAGRARRNIPAPRAVSSILTCRAWPRRRGWASGGRR